MQTSDGIDLVGFLRRPSDTSARSLIVVLAHGFTQSHREWRDFEALLVDGFSTLAMNFRGHGESSGTHQLATVGIDVIAMIKFAKNQGYEQIVCIGASMGGYGCLAAAIETDITGMVILSSEMNPPEGPRLVTKSDIQNLTISKIFMIADEDIFGPELVEAAHEMAEIAGEPKALYNYPGIAHGTGLFYDEEYGEQVLEILLDFLIDLSK